MKYIIGIAAGKGGVGKSTITVNLALALKNLGFAVGILDADIYGPSMQHMLPKGTAPYEKDGAIVPADTYGIKLISMAFFKQEAAAVRAPIANGLINQFIHRVEWGDLDYLFVDFPPGTGDIQLTLAQECNFTGAIVVTTPQEVALIDVRKAIQLFEPLRVPVLGVIENMSYYGKEKIYLFGRDGGKRLAEEYRIPFLGQIPLDPELCACGDEGASIFSKNPHSPSAEVFNLIAMQLNKELSTINRNNRQNFDLNTLKPLAKKIQSLCPCAKCRDQAMQQKDDVEILNMQQSGRFAVRFVFSSGCSQGIYPFSLIEGSLP